MAAVLDGGLYARDGERRLVALGFGSSIALHALILLGTAGLFDPPKPERILPGPIVARLVQAAVAQPAREEAAKAKEEPPAPAEAPKPKPKEPPPPPPPPPTPPPPKPTPLPAPKPTPVPAPAPAPASKAAPKAATEPALSPSPTATPSAEPPRPAETAPTTPAGASPTGKPAAQPAPATPAPAAAAPAEASDAAVLGQYRIAIISAAKRYRRYPRVAMDNNWEGKVEIRMIIGANGMISSITVKTGTGHDILDAQALDMIRKAKPLTQIPPALRGKEFTVDVPIVFSLKEETG